MKLTQGKLFSIFKSVHILRVNKLAICHINTVDDYEDPIEILIGPNIAGKFKLVGRLEISLGLVAIETKLEWSVMRQMPILQEVNVHHY